tara:strand:+ start:95 stop:694 length:600 start_codon:yes stop_codon:yes gene_type:complete
MKKKIILGFLFIIFSFFFLIFYLKSNNENKISEKRKELETVEKTNLEKAEEAILSSNIIEDVSYSAKDINGNEYFLKASEGTIDQNESNFIFLKNVNANINLKNYKLIKISSDFGKYNINNYDTIFSKNVLITYLDNKIQGNYLDFSWEKNLMIISKNVILTSDRNSLQADVIEINVKTKNIKIFMYEDKKKVKIKSFE